MGHKIVLTEEQKEFFKSGNIIHIINPETKKEEIFFNFPYYLKQENESLYELFSPEKLPDYVKKQFYENREEKVEETVSISKKEYTELQNDSNFLRCLEGAGVDNWEGYEIAQDRYEVMEE